MQQPTTRITNEPPRDAEQHLRLVERTHRAYSFDPWRVTFGLTLVALGAIFLLGQAGYLQAETVISTWWPLPLVLLGAFSWIAYPREPVGAALTTLIGAGLLLGSLGIVPGGLGTLWPIVLVAVGAWILLSRGRRADQGTAGEERSIDRFAAFSGLEVGSRSQSLDGGTLTALFGGIDLDLRDAQLPAEGATLDATAVFGGIQVRVPTGWRVELSGLPLFGALEDKTGRSTDLPPEAPTLRIRGTAIFGGVEVKH